MQRRLVVYNGYFVYFLIGFISVLFAPVLPAMIREFGLSLAQAGLIFPARSLGQIGAVFLGGIWSDRIGRKPMILLGSALLGLGSLAVGLGSNWPLVLTAFLLSSVGRGFVSASINALIADTNPHRRGAALNVLHGIYGLGAFVGPFIAGILLLADKGWRPTFIVAGILWLFILIVTAALSFPAPQSAKPTGPPKFAWGGALFTGLMAVAFLYNGTAGPLVGWITSYLQERADIVPAILAANMVSLFYVALTAGRFLWSRVVEGLGYGRVILFCAIGPVVAYPLVIWVQNPWLTALGVVVAGLFFAGLYPTALAFATRKQPELAGTISGTMSMAMAAGNMLVPWATGIIAGYTGLQTALTFVYGLVLVLLGVAIAISRVDRKQARGGLINA